MFDSLLPKKEDNFEKKMIKEQVDIQRQANSMSAVSDDTTHIYDQEGKSDLLKWQQDLEEELIDCVQTLRGYSKIEGEWKKVRDQALCNDSFIYEVVVPQCKPFLSRNLINSNFDEKRILKMLKFTMNDISDAMSDGYDKYDINFRNFDLVIREIKNVIIPAPFRALHGWTKKTDSTMAKRIEAFSDNNQPDKTFVKRLFN